MASRYNNNDDGAPLLVCPRRAGKMEQMYGPPLYSLTFVKPVRPEERIIYNVIPRN